MAATLTPAQRAAITKYVGDWLLIADPTPLPRGWRARISAAGLPAQRVRAAANWLLAYPGGPAAVVQMEYNSTRSNPASTPSNVLKTLQDIAEANSPHDY